MSSFIQFFNYIILSTTILNSSSLTLADCKLSNMTFELENIYTRRKNQEKCRVELEKLNQ